MFSLWVSLASGLTEPRFHDVGKRAALGKLGRGACLPFFFEQLLGGFFEELRRGPLEHIEVVLDVAVAQHEVLVDLKRLQVNGRQDRHKLDAPDAFIRIFFIPVIGLFVEDGRGGALVCVGPAPHLDQALQERDDQFRVLLARHIGDREGRRDIGRPLQRPVRVPGEVLDGLELAGCLREHAQDLALTIHGIDRALFERGLQWTERQVVLVVALQLVLIGVLHRGEHLGLVVPVIWIGELHDLYVVAGHVVQHEHQLDAMLFLDAPPIVLDDVLAFGEADLLALEVRHFVDGVAGAHHHDAAFVNLRRPNETGAANVGLDVDSRVAAAKAHQVVEVVDVVRVPVVFDGGTKVLVRHADLLELFLHPAELLIHIAGRDQRTVGVVELFPVHIHRLHLLAFDCHGSHKSVSFLFCLLFVCIDLRHHRTGGDGGSVCFLLPCLFAFLPPSFGYIAFGYPARLSSISMNASARISTCLLPGGRTPGRAPGSGCRAPPVCFLRSNLSQPL